jgi:creatinine amidohydrolase/Fe(II)-dependent formamide hydrolase-like protein
VRGNTQPLATLMPRLRTGGVRAVSPSGVLGDPTTATEAAGTTLLGELGDALVRHVAAWRPAVPA